MIAAMAVVLALISSNGDLGHARLLGPKAACQLAKRDKIPSGSIYSIPGIYFADGRHGSELELSACDEIFFPDIEGAASDQIAAYHHTFDKKCGGTSRGDYISGVFTGKFVRRKARLYGMQTPKMIDVFVINGIESKDLDRTSIARPK
jgi:hypothetical protein